MYVASTSVLNVVRIDGTGLPYTGATSNQHEKGSKNSHRLLEAAPQLSAGMPVVGGGFLRVGWNEALVHECAGNFHVTSFGKG